MKMSIWFIIQLTIDPYNIWIKMLSRYSKILKLHFHRNYLKKKIDDRYLKRSHHHSTSLSPLSRLPGSGCTYWNLKQGRMSSFPFICFRKTIGFSSPESKNFPSKLVNLAHIFHPAIHPNEINLMAKVSPISIVILLFHAWNHTESSMTCGQGNWQSALDPPH